ncbi:CocE/NonD family hydrolase [Halovivax gelatinilyticus]|uniref:CocE/NonD family hydrolase n=1 Tax=Halovivax gelatinilyticus TaxID=2961597 RepID=UPI0020CA756C|nr:CocE/NonD family hydrolase [Halovivax gelatinilyticus]
MCATSTDVSNIDRTAGISIPVGGETVSATRYRPADASEPLPALLLYYPYRKDDHLVYGAYAPIIEYLAAHGYAVVTADMVGTGASTGTKTETGDYESEGAEAVAIVEWLADRSWCTGSVGMFGKSYGGSTCLSAAVHDPEPLKAIVPIMAGISTYEEVAYLGGTLSPFERAGHWNSQMLALQSLPSSYRDPDGQWSEAWKDHLAQLEEGDPWLFNTMDHDLKDEYWDRRELPVEDVTVPTFAVSGWRDYFPTPTLSFAERIDAPTRVLLGPWRHAMPHRARETTIDFRPRVRAWFDHFLKDEPVAESDQIEDVRSWPKIAFWTEREGGGVVEGGTWRATETWPPSEQTFTVRATETGLTPTELDDGERLEVEYDHDHTVGMYSPDDRPFSVPADVDPDDRRSLTFESDPFEDPIELTGSPTATVTLTSSVEDPMLVVRLTDVAPDGTTRLVSHGRLRLSHRDGHDERRLLDPGTEYTVDLRLKPKSHVFETGHRLRLAISAGFFPLVHPTAREPGRYTVRSSTDAPTSVRFPGVAHTDGVSFPDAIEMGDPDEELVPASSPYTTSKRGRWETSRNQLTDEATVRTTMAHAMELPHGGTMSFDQEIEATAEPDDPTAYVVTSETEATVDYGAQRARSEVTCRLTPDVTHYSVTTTFDDHLVFHRTWRR